MVRLPCVCSLPPSFLPSETTARESQCSGHTHAVCVSASGDHGSLCSGRAHWSVGHVTLYNLNKESLIMVKGTRSLGGEGGSSQLLACYRAIGCPGKGRVVWESKQSQRKAKPHFQGPIHSREYQTGGLTLAWLSRIILTSTTLMWAPKDSSW